MDNELFVAGIGISRDVVSSIVSTAAEKVAGVARVGGNDITSSLISVFTRKPTNAERAVEATVTDDVLEVTVHLAVFFGYVFTQLAEEVRTAIARALSEQIGVSDCVVNVCIDSLVFPKE